MVDSLASTAKKELVSKFQANLDLAFRMRRAFTKSLARVEPEEELKRLKGFSRYIPMEEQEVRQQAVDIMQSLKEQYQDRLLELGRTARANIDELAAQRSVLAEQVLHRGNEDPALRDLIGAIKRGDREEVEDMLRRSPGLVAGTNIVTRSDQRRRQG